MLDPTLPVSESKKIWIFSQDILSLISTLLTDCYQLLPDFNSSAYSAQHWISNIILSNVKCQIYWEFPFLLVSFFVGVRFLVFSFCICSLAPFTPKPPFRLIYSTFHPYFCQHCFCQHYFCQHCFCLQTLLLPTLQLRCKLNIFAFIPFVTINTTKCLKEPPCIKSHQAPEFQKVSWRTWLVSPFPEVPRFSFNFDRSFFYTFEYFWAIFIHLTTVNIPK